MQETVSFLIQRTASSSETLKEQWVLCTAARALLAGERMCYCLKSKTHLYSPLCSIIYFHSGPYKQIITLSDVQKETKAILSLTPRLWIRSINLHCFCWSLFLNIHKHKCSLDLNDNMYNFEVCISTLTVLYFSESQCSNITQACQSCLINNATWRFFFSPQG